VGARGLSIQSFSPRATRPKKTFPALPRTIQHATVVVVSAPLLAMREPSRFARREAGQ